MGMLHTLKCIHSLQLDAETLCQVLQGDSLNARDEDEVKTRSP